MPDQVTEGVVAPDANASQVKQPPEGEVVDPGSEAGSSPAATAPSEAKPKGSDQRYGELTRRWREEQRRSDRLLRHNEELMQRILQSQSPPAQPAQPKTLKDF